MGRKLEVLSAFAYLEHYIVPSTVHLLDEVPSGDLEQFEAAGCLRITEQTEEAPAEEPSPVLSLDEYEEHD